MKIFLLLETYASEDKQFVEQLAESLKKAGIKVWHDNSVLRLGDSIREKIENGLSRSKYGIVVISEKYFTKYWPNRELDGLFANSKKILPIWHNIDASIVGSRSPILKGIYSIDSKQGIPNITNEILGVIQNDTT